jgi:hypothetical protein
MGGVNYFMVIRDFRKEPITQEEVIHCYWYPVVDDTIGGWSISNVDLSVAELNPYEGRFELGSFLTESEAKHIAEIHNTWYQDFIWRTEYIQNYLVSLYNDSIRRIIDACDLNPESEEYWFYVKTMAHTYEDLPDAMKRVKL